MKLIDFLDDWLENTHKMYIKHQTYVRYRSSINNYIRKSKIADMELNDVTRKDVQDFVNGMRMLRGERTGRELSPGTIKNAYVVLQCAYGYAEDYEMVERNPCTRIRLIPKKQQEAKVKCFTVLEQKKIEQYIDGLDNPEYYCYILCLYTGLRIGELCALTWSDVNFAEGTLSVNHTVYCSLNGEGKWRLMTDEPKTRTSFRTIPLPPHVLKALRKIKKRVKSRFVCSHLDGTQLSPWDCRWRYGEMLKTLRLPHITFHGLRHTFATRAIENGMDVRTLSEILGHSNPSVTLSVYTHSLNEHKKNMMKKMTRIG